MRIAEMKLGGPIRVPNAPHSPQSPTREGPGLGQVSGWPARSLAEHRPQGPARVRCPADVAGAVGRARVCSRAGEQGSAGVSGSW